MRCVRGKERQVWEERRVGREGRGEGRAGQRSLHSARMCTPCATLTKTNAMCHATVESSEKDTAAESQAEAEGEHKAKAEGESKAEAEGEQQRQRKSQAD